MPFPNRKEIKKALKSMENEDWSLVGIPPKTTVDKIKYEICKKFVIYIRRNDMTQAQLATTLDIDPARVCEILNYKIHLFTVDRLINLYEKIEPLQVTVA